MKLTGKVQWFNPETGFGFITYNSLDVFVDYTEIKHEGSKSLLENEKVEFEVDVTKDLDLGLIARNVRRIKS